MDWERQRLSFLRIGSAMTFPPPSDSRRRRSGVSLPSARWVRDPWRYGPSVTWKCTMRALVLEHEEHVQDAKRGCGHEKEVAGGCV